MYIIGERINGMFTDVKHAIKDRNEEVISDLAKRQVKAGAKALDLNVGPAAKDAGEAMLWMAQAVRKVTDVPIALDTAKLDVMKFLAERVSGDIILNSTKADPEIASEYIAIAAGHNAGLIGLTIDAEGVPGNIEKRVELGAQIIALAMEASIPMNKLFIDPIILPVNVAPKTPQHCMEAISQLKAFSDPPPHLMLGLSNVSQRCSNRSLINSTYLAMCVAHGLDAAILDPLDEQLMDTAITAELLMEKLIYCDSYLEAARPD